MTRLLARVALLFVRTHKRSSGNYHHTDCRRCALQRAAGLVRKRVI